MRHDLAMRREALGHATAEMDRLADVYRYRRRVFMPPWEAIDVNDAERDHAFDHAKAVHTALVDCDEVPCGPVAERARSVLRALANHRA